MPPYQKRQARENITVRPCLLYLPGWALSDEWVTNNKCFESIENAEATTSTQLHTLKKEDFSEMVRTKGKCVHDEGEYSERG